MTDNEHETDIDAGVQEGQEASPEAWQDDLPPDDGFHDESEEGPAEEIHETNSFTPPAKKSGNTVLLIALAGIALVVGGLAYMQFGSGLKSKAPKSSPVDMAMLSSANPTAQPKSPPPSQIGLKELPVTPTTAESDIASVYNAGLSKTTAPTKNTPSIPFPGSDAGAPPQQDDKFPGADVSEIMTSEPLAPAVQPAEVSAPMPKTADPKKSAALPDALPTASPTIPAPAAAMAHTGTQADVDARLKELTAQLDDLKKTLQQTAQQTSLLATKIENQKGTQQVMPASSEIESRLAQIEHKLAETAVAKQKILPKKEVKDVTKKEDDQQAPDVPKTPKKAAPAKAKASHWVLRAATPDSAWVSDGADSADLKQVQIGDTLQGLGKIKEIKQTGDGWTLVGTKGSLR